MPGDIGHPSARRQNLWGSLVSQTRLLRDPISKEVGDVPQYNTGVCPLQTHTHKHSFK